MFIFRLIKFFLKLIAKIILFPVLMILFTLQLLANLVVHLSGLGVIIMIVVCLGGIYMSVKGQQWTQAGFWGVVMVLSSGVALCTGIILAVLEDMTGGLLGFMLG